MSSVFSVLYERIPKTSNNKNMSKLFRRLRSGVSVSMLPLTGRFLVSAALRVRVKTEAALRVRVL
jgi:hypothetical protein